MLRGYLQDNNWLVADVSKNIFTASNESSDHIWLTGCLTTSDSEIVHRIAREHGSVRRLLLMNGVRVPQTLRAGTKSQVIDFLNKTQESVLLGKGRASWDNWLTGERISLDEVTKLNTSFSPRMLAQNVPVGQRFKVFSSNSTVYAILGEMTIESDLAEALSETAVKATQSIPGLRWGSWQIVRRTNGRLLVEGLSMNPMITEKDYLLAGSMENLWDQILKGVSSSLPVEVIQ